MPLREIVDPQGIQDDTGLAALFGADPRGHVEDPRSQKHTLAVAFARAGRKRLAGGDNLGGKGVGYAFRATFFQPVYIEYDKSKSSLFPYVISATIASDEDVAFFAFRVGLYGDQRNIGLFLAREASPAIVRDYVANGGLLTADAERVFLARAAGETLPEPAPGGALERSRRVYEDPRALQDVRQTAAVALIAVVRSGRDPEVFAAIQRSGVRSAVAAALALYGEGPIIVTDIGDDGHLRLHVADAPAGASASAPAGAPGFPGDPEFLRNMKTAEPAKPAVSAGCASCAPAPPPPPGAPQFAETAGGPVASFLGGLYAGFVDLLA